MKIIFIGNFNVDYSSETHYLKTFQRLGHEVINIQEGSPIDVVMAEDQLRSSQMVFWVHTHGWYTDGLETLLNKAKDLNIPIIGYHLDLWMGIERQKDLKLDYYWKYLDHFYCTDKLMVDYLNEKTAIKAHYLAAGVFKDECYMGDPEDQYKHDVIFVGSRFYHPEWPYRGELIEFLERTYGDRFAQYGNGGRGTIRGDELNNLYASSKIVVGDTLCKDFKYPHYFSDRLFETTGRGGFLIFPYIEGIKNYFVTPDRRAMSLTTDRIELITYDFGDFDYLKYLIDYFLHNEEERQAIQKRGFLRTAKDHTYDNRLQVILNSIK